MLAIPLQITRQGFLREDSVEKSINRAIELLLQTPCYDCRSDPKYGFIFKNLRFEIFNEREGTVNSPVDGTSSPDGWLYKKKVSGTSRNLNTFASDLQKAIVQYEPRLSGVSVSLTYVREEKTIYVAVKGTIPATKTPYKYQTTIKVWN